MLAIMNGYIEELLEDGLRYEQVNMKGGSLSKS